MLMAPASLIISLVSSQGFNSDLLIALKGSKYLAGEVQLTLKPLYHSKIQPELNMCDEAFEELDKLTFKWIHKWCHPLGSHSHKAELVENEVKTVLLIKSCLITHYCPLTILFYH